MTQVEALMAIARRDGGMITPAAVVDEARDPNSVLHGAFTWDDTVAAEKWRIHEAQHLIRECRITITKPDSSTVKTYAFIGISSDRTGASEDNPYRIASDVASVPDLLAIAVKDAVEQLKALKRRYSHLKQLDSIWNAIDALQ